MRGLNHVVFSGNVGSIIYTETHVKNDPVITFMLCSEREENFTTWAKICVYGKLALYCKDRLQKGSYVLVDGELKNRRSRSSEYLELEIKATNRLLIFDSNAPSLEGSIPKDLWMEVFDGAKRDGVRPHDFVENVLREYFKR